MTQLLKLLSRPLRNFDTRRALGFATVFDFPTGGQRIASARQIWGQEAGEYSGNHRGSMGSTPIVLLSPEPRMPALAATAASGSAMCVGELPHRASISRRLAARETPTRM